MSADLLADTRAIPDPDHAGRYHVHLSDSWDYLMPSGGVVKTAHAQAAASGKGKSNGETQES